MDKSISLSNSPSPIKRTGNTQRAFELCGELYSLVQQWNLLISSGKIIIKKIIQLRIASWDNSGHNDSLVQLAEQSDQLEKILQEMGLIPLQMEKIKDHFAAVEKLENFHLQKQTSSSIEDVHPTLFLTWLPSKFVAVASSIQHAYSEEFKLKKCIAENIAHCQQRQQLDFHQIAWAHKVCITPSVQLDIESMLVETVKIKRESLGMLMRRKIPGR